MLVKKRSRAGSLVIAAAAFALIFAAPARAHQGERHEPAAQTMQSQPVGDQAAPDAEMSGAQMAWPTTVDDDDDAMGMHHERPKTLLGRLIAWLGAWHPAIVHFPVALLLTAAFLEILAAVRSDAQVAAGNKMLLGLAALSACFAAPLGWADAGLPTVEDEWFLTAHRWLGTALPFLMLVLWRLKSRSDGAQNSERPPYYEAVLIAAVLAVLAQAYLGGDITHGVHHLDF
jgi:uncharacterized membrane protein